MRPRLEKLRLPETAAKPTPLTLKEILEKQLLETESENAAYNEQGNTFFASLTADQIAVYKVALTNLTQEGK